LKELAKNAAKDIVHTCKVIDFLIDALPGIENSEEEQVRIDSINDSYMSWSF
jgi:hypothetical protein